MDVTKEQILDEMDLEREHGVTIKAHPVRMEYTAKDGKRYLLNLIDTPGHVDFTYEVSRALAATEGVILLVDASQGVEAQTLAHLHLAMGLEKEILPALNKIDLPHADPYGVTHQLKEILPIDDIDPLHISAKEGIGVEDVLEGIVERFPPPSGDEGGPLRALIFDSHFDPYKGVILYIRVVDGSVRVGDRVMFMATGVAYEVSELGVFSPWLTKKEILHCGEVGYMVAGIKKIGHTRVGDTITSSDRPAPHPLPGYKETKPMVFCGLYPLNSTPYETLKGALSKLHLNDPSWVYRAESSQVLGAGFRCGFLGLFHMQIIQERLEREYGLDLLITTPTVPYRIERRDGKTMEIENPQDLPPQGEIAKIEEPYLRVTIITPAAYLGEVLKLCESRRGTQSLLEYLDKVKVMVVYELPLSEVIGNFYDRLKSITRGYGSMDYEEVGYRSGNLVRLDVLVGGKRIEPLTSIVPKEKAYTRARELISKLKELIPAQQFACPIQGAVGGRVIARQTIPALKKHVTAKCYGGDITRKKKLWAKQKEGKKRLKRFGRVDIPQEAFMAILKIG